MMQVKAMVTLKRENDEELLITADGMGLILVWETDSFQCKQVTLHLVVCICYA